VWVCGAIVVELILDWTYFIIKGFCIPPVISTNLKEQGPYWEGNGWSAAQNITVFYGA
jgi:hypothetical protein